MPVTRQNVCGAATTLPQPYNGTRQDRRLAVAAVAALQPGAVPSCCIMFQSSHLSRFSDAVINESDCC